MPAHRRDVPFPPRTSLVVMVCPIGIEPMRTAFQTAALPTELRTHGAAERNRTSAIRLTRSVLGQHEQLRHGADDGTRTRYLQFGRLTCSQLHLIRKSSGLPRRVWPTEKTSAGA